MTKAPISKAAAALAAALALNFAAPAEANIFEQREVKRWDMCDSRDIPRDVLDRIMKRSDFEDILRRMFNACPETALWLTDRPTASVSGIAGFRDNRGREPDRTSSTSGGPSPERERQEPDSPLGGPGPSVGGAPEAPDAPDLGLPG